MTAVQQEFARLSGASREEITSHFFNNFGVVAQQHFDGKLWLLDYDQLAAHKHRTSEVVMESRGLVLCAETQAIVRRPFARFFNIGEAPSYESDIDFTRLQALEKADGSLVTLYANSVTGHWHFGTRGTPFADSGHRLGGKFYHRVMTAAGLTQTPGTAEFDARMAALLQSGVTYIFEFIGPENPHITPYSSSELVLLGARRHDGVEFTKAQVQELFDTLRTDGWNVRLPVVYDIEVNLADLSRSQQVEAIKLWVAESRQFKNLHEGVVCQDPITGKRVKVKTPLYCAAHLQGNSEGMNLSLSRIVELIVNGDTDEFCLYAPHLEPMVRKAQGQVDDYLQAIEPIWAQVKSIEDQKAFSLAVQQHVPAHATGLFFQARKTNSSPMTAWLSLPMAKKVSFAEKLVKV